MVMKRVLIVIFTVIAVAAVVLTSSRCSGTEQSTEDLVQNNGIRGWKQTRVRSVGVAGSYNDFFGKIAGRIEPDCSAECQVTYLVNK